MGRVISVVFQNPATALNPAWSFASSCSIPCASTIWAPRPSREKRVKELWSSPVCPVLPPRFFPASFRAASASASQLPVPCR